MYRFTYRYIFLQRHSAFLSQYACIVQQRWRFWASLYSQSKSDALRNLNFRYKGKLELSVLLPWLPWLVKRDELRLASGIFLIYLYCASKAERKLRKKLLAANTNKTLSQYACIVQQRWRFWASLYSQSKSDALRNLNFRYKGKLELSVLLPWLPWLVKRDELRLASGIFLIYLYCASKAERKLRKKLLAANTNKT